MSELGDLLELLVTAERRSRTVRLVVRRRTDPTLAADVRTPLWDDEGAEVEDRPSRRAPTTVRLWHRSGGGLREEIGEDPDSRKRAIVSPPDRGSEEGLVRFAEHLDELRLEVVDRGSVAGRETIEARASQRPIRDIDEFDALEPGADAYDLSVDAERGVVLAYTAWRRGAELARVEADEVAYDEPLPDELFVSRLEEDEPIAPVGGEGREVEPREAAALASFRVFMPIRVAEGWEQTVVYGEADDSEPEWVSVHLERGNGLHRVSVVQRAVGAESTEDDWWPEWRDDSHAGERILVSEPEPDAFGGGMQGVRVEREGTQITIGSQTLPRKRLLDLLDVLEPVG